MKQNVIIILCTLSVLFTYAQNKTANSVQSTETAETLATAKQTIALTYEAKTADEGGDLEEKAKTKKANLAMKLVQNSVAGFSPMFFGGFETNKKFKVTMYSIFWTNTSFGNPQAGSDLLVETGVGLAFPLLNNQLVINPSIGFGHGKFFSNVSGTRVGEGIIPNIFAAFHNDRIDSEAYLSYYKSFRNNEEINTQDYVLLILAPGININKRLTVGAFYESLAITRQEVVEGDDNVQLYQFLGGSVKVKFDNGVAFRFSGGPNLSSDIGASKEFYKTSVIIPL